MPTLRELEARFLKLTDDRGSSQVSETLEGADGVLFLCPKCWLANKGPVNTHSVICWFDHVDPKVSPGPGRWNPQGTGLDDLTFIPGKNQLVSVNLTGPGGCRWHGHVRDGKATLD